VATVLATPFDAAGRAGAVPAALAAGLVVVAAALLFLEQRWAEDVNLAFFKVNVWVGAVVLLAVLAARWRP
jgi:4-hydroxybenzoate polyprenyltransferase